MIASIETRNNVMKLNTLALLPLLVATTFASKSTCEPVDYVDPFIGTSNSRWMLFPGPAMPFGMVKLSPDNQGVVWNGGYEYTVNSISGFSNIHSWAMSGVSIMPTIGTVKTFPGTADGPFDFMWTAGYRSRFDKSTEKASVGYYKVDLYDSKTRAELTATERCGYLKFTFPETEQANVLMNFNFDFEENNAGFEGAWVERVSDTELQGYAKKYSSYADHYTVHFVIRFSKPFKKLQSWEREPFEGEYLFGDEWQAKVDFQEITAQELAGFCGAYAQFETEKGEVVEVQIGTSLVSVDQARLNLETELDPFGWDFDAVVKNCRDTWNELLSRISIRGGTHEDRVKFYTNLYRAYVSRTEWNDVNGKYIDMCEQERTLESPAKNIYGSDALWGAHWNLFPLWTLVTPNVANDWINSLLEMYRIGGWLPQGPEGIEYCQVMVAAHQIKLIVSAYQKGIRDFDIETAYEAIRKNQTVPGHAYECGGWVGNKNLESFLKYGYVANEDGPVSNTLEFAFDDWAVAQLAKALGKEADYEMFMERSQAYRNIFDPETGYMRQKNADGSWVEDWDPLHAHGTWYGSGYVEGTAWHYTFFVPHDYKGLIELVGREELINRLDEGFKKRYIDIGNQPNMQAPFIFNHLGAPQLTQKWIRHALKVDFDATPLRGWPGEEDQGQMGAFFVMSSLGLFQMDGGCSEESWYDLGSPLFDEAVLKLDEKYYGGKTLKIVAHDSSPENIYVQKILFNGKPVENWKISHHDLVQGGLLEFFMTSEAAF